MKFFLAVFCVALLVQVISAEAQNGCGGKRHARRPRYSGAPSSAAANARIMALLQQVLANLPAAQTAQTAPASPTAPAQPSNTQIMAILQQILANLAAAAPVAPVTPVAPVAPVPAATTVAPAPTTP